MTQTSVATTTFVGTPQSSLPASARVTRLAAAVVIALSATGRLAVNLSGYYLLDDYAFIGRAGRPDALSWSALTEPHLGHLMPAAHVVNWVVQAIAPWNYTLPAVLMSCGWLMCLMLMYGLLTRWLGTAPVVLLPLVAYAITPLTMQATTWWAAAFNSIPLQVCALVAARCILPLAGSQKRLDWRQQSVVFACFIVALAFFSKAVLLPLLFFGLAFAWSQGRGRAAWSHAWRAAPSLWLSLAVGVVLYLGAYWSTAGGERPPLGAAGPMELLARSARSITGALIPSWAGGPVDFTPGADPWGLPPSWVTALGVAALAGCIALVVRGSARSRRFALLTAVYATGCIALLTVGRQAFIEVSSGALRYFAEWSIPASLLIASLASDFLGPKPRRSNAARWVAAGLCMAVFCVVSLATTQRLADNPEARAIREVASTSLESLNSEAPGTILDQWAPAKVLTPLYGDYARSSWLYADAPGQARFAEQGDVLRTWDPAGRLVPARVEGPVARLAGTCATTTEGVQRLTMSGAVYPFTHVVQVTATSRVAAEVLISIGGGPAELWALPAGLVTAYRVQVAGNTTEIVIQAPPDSGACVTEVRVGASVVAEGTS